MVLNIILQNSIGREFNIQRNVIFCGVAGNCSSVFISPIIELKGMMKSRVEKMGFRRMNWITMREINSEKDASKIT